MRLAVGRYWLAPSSLIMETVYVLRGGKWSLYSAPQDLIDQWWGNSELDMRHNTEGKVWVLRNYQSIIAAWQDEWEVRPISGPDTDERRIPW